MTKPITAATALRLAREALEDDKRMTPGPWTPADSAARDERYCQAKASRATIDANGIAASRTREPQLAAWVEAVLGMPGAVACRVNVSHDGTITISDHAPKMDGSHVRYRVSARHARAIAAALLRAADEATEAEPAR